MRIHEAVTCRFSSDEVERVHTYTERKREREIDKLYIIVQVHIYVGKYSCSERMVVNTRCSRYSYVHTG